jgi:purine-nucleoside/S-methyl-5'-thioadenosine phosphorylase / adenosine deaminase
VSWRVDRWKNFEGLAQTFGDRFEASPTSVRTLRQVHGLTVRIADEAVGEGTGDGLATDRSGVSVGVWTADCVPLHLVVPGARVAAAIHCGWRGSAAGIVPAALDLLERRWGVAPPEVEAALGPAIGGCCYQVGEEVREAFVSRVGSRLGQTGFTARGGGLFLELRAFLEEELRGRGVGRVERIGPCTACRHDLLHSYRQGRGAPGRQLSWIGWLD